MAGDADTKCVDLDSDASIRVVIVDDQELVRLGLSTIISAASDIEVVGGANDGAEALSVVDELRPDVVVMDVRMEPMDGIEATRQLIERETTARILVVTTYGNEKNLFDAIRAGASGFLSKDVSARELHTAIRVIAGGDALLSPNATQHLIEAFASMPETNIPTDSEALDRLTGREREVLLLVARGRSNAEIAEELFVAETTIKTHVSRMLTKLNLRDRAQVVVFAYEAGIARPSGLS